MPPSIHHLPACNNRVAAGKLCEDCWGWRTSRILPVLLAMLCEGARGRYGDVHVVELVVVQVLLLAFSLSELAFGTLVASIFSRAKIAAIVGPLLHFCLLLPR